MKDPVAQNHLEIHVELGSYLDELDLSEFLRGMGFFGRKLQKSIAVEDELGKQDRGKRTWGGKVMERR